MSMQSVGMHPQCNEDRVDHTRDKPRMKQSRGFHGKAHASAVPPAVPPWQLRVCHDATMREEHICHFIFFHFLVLRVYFAKKSFWPVVSLDGENDL
jgi:hypothetical protein